MKNSQGARKQYHALDIKLLINNYADRQRNPKPPMSARNRRRIAERKPKPVNCLDNG